MATSERAQRLREWGSLLLALALGPAFIVAGYQMRLAFSPAAVAGGMVCVLVVPLLTLVGQRLKFVVWQVGVISITLAVIGDNVRINAMHRSEIPSVAYVFWASGTLLSCPLPIYFSLRPLTPRQRYLAGIAIATAAFGLWLGINRITR